MGLQTNRVLEMIIKYGDDMGSKFPSGLLFECNWKFLKGFFQF